MFTARLKTALVLALATMLTTPLAVAGLRAGEDLSPKANALDGTFLDMDAVDAILARRAAALDAAGLGDVGELVAGQRTDLALARELISVTEGSSYPLAGVLDAARLAIATRQESLSSTPADVAAAQKLAHEQANIDLAHDLLALDAEGSLDPLARGVAMAKRATLAHVSTLGATEPAPAGVPTHDAPSEAAFALLAAQEVVPTEAESGRILALDALTPDLRRALADWIDAFAAFDAASHAAFAAVDDRRLHALAAQTPTPDEWDAALQRLLDLSDASPEEFADLHDIFPAASADSGAFDWQLDLLPLLLARNDFLDATLALRDTLLTDGVTAYHEPVQVAPVLSIDLNASNDVHTQDFILVLDAGGDDVYYNNAGGNNLGGVCDVEGTRNAAALVDLAGTDSYASWRSCGANGGAWFGGAGLLVDAEGNDVYEAGSQGTNGGGYFGGVGLLLDASGDDSYTGGSGGVNGGAMVGLGALVDGAGQDAYYSDSEGTNGGASVGWLGVPDPVGFLALPPALGLLVDAGGGMDLYSAVAVGVNGASQGWYTAGKVHAHVAGFLLDAGGDDAYRSSMYGANGGGIFNGLGFLLDASGNDRYSTARNGFFTNGGAYYGGVGVLIDGSGDDSYVGGRGRGVNGAAIAARFGPLGLFPQPTFGLLIDGDGSDRYSGGNWAVNGGAWRQGGSGLLFDGGAGDDVYLAQALYTNGGGGFSGQGALVDAGGNDLYSSLSPVFDAFGANGGAIYRGVGFLMDGGGHDRYVTSGIGANGGATTGSAGALIDLGGDDVYEGTADGVNGGATGRSSGLLVDADGNDSYAATTGGVNGGGALDDGEALVCDVYVTYQCFGSDVEDSSLSVGLLLDAGGLDIYDDRDGGFGADHTIVSKGVGGAQLDLPVRDAPIPPVPPGPPGRLAATSGPDSLAVTLTWDSPTRNGGLAVREFVVYRDGAAIATVGDVRLYVDAGLVEDQTYSYEVRGVNALGEGEGASAASTARFCGVFEDAYGYTCARTGFVWYDMSAATPLSVPSWSASEAIALPFELAWYGETKTDVYVASSGHVCFSEYGCGVSFSHTSGYGDDFYAFPSPEPANDLVACYWAPLDPELGGTISYATHGTAPDRVFVVEYSGMTRWESAGSATLQLHLHESGAAECMIANADIEPSWPVAIGTENSDGSIGVRYVYGDIAASGLAIRFAPPS